jgi:DNA polymerase elongation subunit (family B)
MNICKSTQLTRARALELGVPVVTPPAADLSGTWRTPHGEMVVCENFRTGVITINGEVFRYENDLNESIVCGDRRAELFDYGYGLRWSNGDEWTRDPADILCFVTREHFYGIVPQMERDLKVDRKKAKKQMADAEARGDKAAETFFNNQQNSIKVLMNVRFPFSLFRFF